MSAAFVLGVIIALLLLANWVTLYARSDQVYQFKDGDMKIIASPQSKSAYSKFSSVHQLKATPSNDAAQVTPAHFGIMDSYFNAAAGLCPSQRQKAMEQYTAPQHALLKVGLSDFRLAVDETMRLNAGARSILDVRTAIRRLTRGHIFFR
jgi:hypothetical protein